MGGSAGTSARDRPDPPDGGAGARVWDLATPLGPWVVKLAGAARMAHEAQILGELAGSGLAPRLVAAGEGIVITARIDGAPSAPAGWRHDQAVALGRLLARVHTRSAPTGVRAPIVPTGRDGLVAAIRRDCPSELRATIDEATAVLPTVEPGPPALLHGDPWSGNVVWSPAGPVLVDWEYARAGEPAEDLAYLAALDALPDALLDAILAGYGADAALIARVRAWRPLLSVWCGAWLMERGKHDRGVRLVAHAERLLMRGAVG